MKYIDQVPWWNDEIKNLIKSKTKPLKTFKSPRPKKILLVLKDAKYKQNFSYKTAKLQVGKMLCPVYTIK